MCVEGGWEGGGVYRCTHLVWFIHKRLPWFFILKSLSLSVLHELLQRHQPIFVLVHLGGEREGGREGRRERGREGRREGGGKEKREGRREGRGRGIYSITISLTPHLIHPHTYLGENMFPHASHLLMGFHTLHVITIRLPHL